MTNKIKDDEKFYTCKNDLAFKEVFMKEDNKDLLIAIIESVLNIKIKDLEYLNLEKNVDNIHVRRKHFDLHVKTEKQNIHIEVNSQMKDYVRTRNISFLFDTYAHETKRGSDYSEKILFIQINFSYGLSENSKYNKGKREPFYVYTIKDQRIINFINNLVIYEVDMDYIIKLWYNNKEKRNRYKYLVMMNLQLDELKIVSNKDRMVEKYMNELKRVNEDHEFREYISAEEDNLKIENSIKKQERQEGHDIGVKNEKVETAKRMLEKGMDKQTILDITKLSEEELNNIINKKEN